MTRVFLMAVAALAFAACMAPMAHLPLQQDPSSPDAPEGAVAQPPTLAPDSTPSSSSTHGGMRGMAMDGGMNMPMEMNGMPMHGGMQMQGTPMGPSKPLASPATVYVCPMHPDVTSTKPGRCPKCGMTLVPKRPAKEAP